MLRFDTGKVLRLGIMITLLLAVTLMLGVSSAKAGTNGQQLEIIGNINTGTIFIMGYNQNSQLTTYSFKCVRLGFCITHKTTGRWWKGIAKIQVTDWLGNKKVCTVNVPKVWPSNYYRVYCGI